MESPPVRMEQKSDENSSQRLALWHSDGIKVMDGVYV